MDVTGETMCLLIVLFQVHPDLPLVIGANRDQRLDRPGDGDRVAGAGPPDMGLFSTKRGA